MEYKRVLTALVVTVATYIRYACAQTVWLNTSLGEINGLTYTVVGTDVDVFLGIPYARPPLVERRFAPPVPAEAWGRATGNQSITLNATKYSAACPQHLVNSVPAPWSPATSKVYHFSEDCLYLNIFVPKVSQF